MQCGALHTLAINSTVLFPDIFYLHDLYCLCAEEKHVYA